MARSKGDRRTRQLFRSISGQDEMFERSYEEELEARRNQPVECLGLTFESDEKRREYFLEKLRQKLKDPDFRKIEGFPIGEDEDILALSDPPYYTACPNPFVEDFIKNYGKPYNPATDDYRREPFAADVSEGKNDPIYNAHSYHTKVPHKAIMRYILHYTQPGDVIFDGFGGTGMAGVAAQLCGRQSAVALLGLRIEMDGTIWDEDGHCSGILGFRKAIIGDLSPLATFVASRYNDFDASQYSAKKLQDLISSIQAEFKDLYTTRNPESGATGRALFYVWSDVFSCPECTHSSSLFEFAVDGSTYKLKSVFSCLSCNAELTKDNLDRIWATRGNNVGSGLVKEAKSQLVEVCAKFGDQTIRFPPTQFDHDVLASVEQRGFDWVPEKEFPVGRQTRKVKSGSGIATIPQMFTPRALAIVSRAWSKVAGRDGCRVQTPGLFLLSSALTLLSRRERYRDGTGKGSQSGTLYVPSLQIEKNAFDVIERKRKSFAALDLKTHRCNAAVTCQSHNDLRNIASNSIDYIFTDPPFGESLQYGELNFFYESWFRIHTHLESDCVLNYVHEKDLRFYRRLMSGAFTEAYRILKPGRWITVEFHNSQNNVWTAIQEALWNAGFTIADVRVLDKKQGTFNVVNRAGAVKQDLVISAYKPNGGLEERFKIAAGREDGSWDFVRTHLKQLPVFVSKDGQAEIIAERQNYLLFDRMVAFHVQRGVTVPLSASEFYVGLEQRFPERYGMYFLPHQAAEYDKKRMTVKEVLQLQLFVSDEASAIQWLKQLLTKKPQTFQDIHPQFLREIGGWQKHEELPELSEMLEQNFLSYDGSGDVPSQIHSYLSSNFKEFRNLVKDHPSLRAKAKDRWYVPDPNKAADLERLRERTLLREFEGYREPRQKRLKVFRLEAVRAGFRKAWQERNYNTIIAVACKIPETILHEDPKLLMWYDQALTRSGDEV